MNLWGFISAAVLLTLMPGPDILFVITQSITRGRKAGMVFAAGLCTGLIAHVTAVSLGVSILLMSSPVAFTMLKFAGAAYLLYLGVKAFLARRENHFELSGDAAVSGKLYRKGIPIIVMQNRTPQKMCDRKIQIPPIKNQMMFIRVERHPWGDCLCTISLPKGHNANIPSLTVWSPKGIPMIVINNPILAMKYSTATKIPPNSNQMIFPKIFMFQR